MVVIIKAALELSSAHHEKSETKFIVQQYPIEDEEDLVTHTSSH